jgi:hypothetical protein
VAAGELRGGRVETLASFQRAGLELEPALALLEDLARIKADGRAALVEHVTREAEFRPNDGVSVSVSVVGVYPVRTREPCHLIELIVSGAEGQLRIEELTQPQPGRDRGGWQVPYDEVLLEPDGAALLRSSEDAAADRRIAFFFHYLNLFRPLQTPFGQLWLPDPSPRPKRLEFIKYVPVD